MGSVLQPGDASNLYLALLAYSVLAFPAGVNSVVNALAATDVSSLVFRGITQIYSTTISVVRNDLLLTLWSLERARMPSLCFLSNMAALLASGFSL